VLPVWGELAGRSVVAGLRGGRREGGREGGREGVLVTVAAAHTLTCLREGGQSYRLGRKLMF